MFIYKLKFLCIFKFSKFKSYVHYMQCTWCHWELSCCWGMAYIYIQIEYWKWLVVLTAHFTTKVVQLIYTINLQKKKKQKEECKGRIDIDHVKAVVWDKLIAFMNKVFWFTWVRKYIPWLFIRVQNFHKKSYYMIWWKFDKEGTRTWSDKTIKNSVFHKEYIHEMFSIFLKASRSWIQFIRTIV